MAGEKVLAHDTNVKISVDDRGGRREVEREAEAEVVFEVEVEVEAVMLMNFLVKRFIIKLQKQNNTKTKT